MTCLRYLLPRLGLHASALRLLFVYWMSVSEWVCSHFLKNRRGFLRLPLLLTILEVFVGYPRILTLYVLHSPILYNGRTGKRYVLQISYWPIKGVSRPRSSACGISVYVHVLAV